MQANKRDGKEGRVCALRTENGGASWSLASYLGPEPEGYQIMPADEVIAKIKANDPSLTVMDMSERQLQGSRCEILAEAMMNNSSITEVDFRGNGFDADGLFALVQAFRTMPSLTRINLRGNSCRNEGVEALARWLSTNKLRYRELRFDVAAVVLSDHSHDLRYFESAFE